MMIALLFTILLALASAQDKNTEIQSRIVGGTAVYEENKFPYFVYIRIQPKTGTSANRPFQFCGGTLIGPKAVLTAAHCVYDKNIDVSVQVGKISEADTSVVTIKVEAIALHPSFYKFYYIHDIAILRLETALDYVTPALLPFNRYKLPQIKQKLTAIGFGLKDAGTPSTVLRQVLITVQPTKDCDVFNFGVNATRQFCAGEAGKVPCSGDSGGPALVGTTKGDMVAGIVSYGGFDCFSFPAVFTRVSAYEDFIVSNACIGTNLPSWCKPMLLVGQNACFEGSNLVNVAHRGPVPIKDLQIGDEVLVGKKVYEPVYSFGHLARDSEASFLHITTDHSKLVITDDHLVYTQARGAVPASVLRAGDALFHESGSDRIISIRTVNGNGLYAPFTPSGKIVVNGILASSYVALEKKDGLEVFGGLFTVSHQWLAHASQVPHRLVCYHFGSCPQENYSSEGISLWVDKPFKIAQWLVATFGSMSFLWILPVCMAAAVLTVLESLLMSPRAVVILVALTVVTIRYRLKCKNA